ncbi:hypothetical protein M2444_005350 [Paenibacillus sp. PastF-3]|uniref:phage tail protein n=1 Tax=Paenibacillus sp. PastF-3 TaxID=2940626 RepID=UPI002473FA6E|nr:phage tail protein [Paenibacillus sp. PastF-3]MDH6373518.1 hypothetical protein [Paenibacillus sp. PastF-3]
MNDYLLSYDKNMKPLGALVDVLRNEIQRKRRINSDYELSFTVPMISEDYRDLIKLKGHIKDERGQFYVINSRSRVREDRKLTASIMCTHIMFKLADYKFPYAGYIDEAYGVHISQLTNLISLATGERFTFSIDDTFDLVDVKDFGRGNCLQALNKIIEMYVCEVDPDNFVIHLKKKIGKDDGVQYRIKKNIISDQFKDDTTSLVTRLFCEMKDGVTWIGQPASILSNEERFLLEAVPGAIVDGLLRVNYLISPYTSVWSSDSVPFYDGELTEQDIDASVDLPKAVSQLLEAARRTLREKEIPAFEVTADGADLYKIDNEEPKPGLGDIAYCHDPDMEIVKLKARITELTEYPYTKEKHAQATISNIMPSDMDDLIADLDKSKTIVDNIFSGGRVRAAIFEEFARLAVHDINNSKTELIYPPEGGILAQDKNNPLRQVRLTSAGLGISTDGWNTLRAAITADGVMAEQVIGQFGNFVSMLIGEGNNVVQINTHGMAAGHANFNEAKFQVNMAGDVIARSIKLTGEIEQSTMISSLVQASRFVGNEIEGGVITGSFIRTAASGQRVEMDVNSFRSVDASGKIRVSISQNGKYGVAGTEYFDDHEIFKGGVYGIDDGLYIEAPSYMNLYSPIIAFNGEIRFGNASVKGIQIGSIEGLQAEINALWSALSGKSNLGHSHSYSVSIPNHNHGNPANVNSGGGTFPVT